MGADKHVVTWCKKYLDKAFKNKYFKRGYKAARKNKGRNDNPYKLTPEIISLLRKRTWWDLGWEQKAFSKTPKQLAEIERKNKEFKRLAEKRHKHEKHEREEKESKKHKRHEKSERHGHRSK